MRSHREQGGAVGAPAPPATRGDQAPGDATPDRAASHGHRWARWTTPDFRRRVARSVLLVLLVAAVLGGGLLGIGLLQVRDSLESARGELGEVRSALGDLEMQRASKAVASTDAELERARGWTENGVWSAATYLPVAGRSFAMTRDVVEVGSAAVAVAGIAVRDGEQLLGGGFDLAFEDGRVDLSPLLATRALMERLPIGRLEVARDALAVPREGWIPGQVLDGRTETLALADEVLETAEHALALTTALPGFLGVDGERRYFVGVQTSAELRGTGGLIGYFGILTIDDGAIDFSGGGSQDTDGDAPDVGRPEDEGAAQLASPDTTYYGALNVNRADHVVDAEPEFAARYAGVAAMSHFANVNVDPDLPATARVALDLFASHTGQQLDGMLLLDPVGLERLLTVTGSELDLDAEVAASLGSDRGAVATDRFSELATFEVYDRLGAEHTAARRLALRTLGDAAFDQVFAGGWSGTEMAGAVADAGRSRHLQVFSEHPGEQEAFTDVGVTGALPAEPDIDAMVLVANNAVGGKQDVHLGHEFALQVVLDDVRQRTDGTFDADRSTALQATLDNPLPSSGMDEYILGNCVVPEASNSCFRGEPGMNWTWFSAFLPSGSNLIDSHTDALSQSLSEYGAYHGFHVVDHFQATPPESRGTFELDFDGRVPLQPTADALVYELLWWRQAKATPDLLDVIIEPPPGWEVVDLEVVGGGDGRGSGVHGDGVEFDAEVTDGVAHLHGTVTADTRMRVHLVETGT